VIEWTDAELAALRENGWGWPEFPKGVWAKGDVWRLGKKEGGTRALRRPAAVSGSCKTVIIYIFLL
jgi:hypothetical protein